MKVLKMNVVLKIWGADLKLREGFKGKYHIPPYSTINKNIYWKKFGGAEPPLPPLSVTGLIDHITLYLSKTLTNGHQ